MDLPDDAVLRALVATYARLRAAHGDAIGEPALVQPTGEFFPDVFAPDAPGVARLLGRMLTYAPLASDLPMELAFVTELADGGPGHGGGCGSAACGSRGGERPRAGTVDDLGERYRVSVAAADVGQPVLLASSLARAVGGLVLLEAGSSRSEGDDDAATSEVAAAMCGLGVLLAAGSAVWAKACGGLSMAQGTALSVEEATVVLALFVAVHRHKATEASRHLDATQREAFEHAVAWTESNPLLIETLRDRPGVLECGVYDLEPTRGLIGRWLHKRRLERDLRAPAAQRAAPLTEAQRRRLEEARALVGDAFDGS